MNDVGEAARKVLEQAMGLSDEERELVAVELLASLGGRDDGWEEAWSTEIERRVAEIRSGAVELRSWADVKASYLARLRQR